MAIEEEVEEVVATIEGEDEVARIGTEKMHPE